MEFIIDSAIFDHFPGVTIGLVITKGITNTGEAPEIMSALRTREQEIKSSFETETLSQHPKIDAWRKAYSSFGAKPKKYRCSVENLYRMIIEGIELRHISKLVDIYNYVSIKHMVPAGGDDLDKVDGDITLTIAKGDEPFVELNAQETKNPDTGEVIYRDNKEVLCRRWNWRECDKSKMTEQTKNAALVIEGLPPVTKEDVITITAELATLIKQYCGGEVRQVILDEKNQKTTL